MQNRTGAGCIAGDRIEWHLRCYNVVQPHQAHVAVRVDQIAARQGVQPINRQHDVEQHGQQSASQGL